jgi:hypothetical protein
MGLAVSGKWRCKEEQRGKRKEGGARREEREKEGGGGRERNGVVGSCATTNEININHVIS